MVALRRMPPINVNEEVLKEWGQIWLGEVATQPRSLKRIPGSKRQRVLQSVEPAPLPEEVLAEPMEAKKKKSNYFDKKQAMDFGYVFDKAFGDALAEMLGGIPVLKPSSKKTHLLVPPEPDCVEVGLTRVVGAIRPQNYDAAYRPDGPRVVYDSKTLNERKSIGKNWQNMINDLTAEASTVHIRFPMCIVAFIVAVPRQALEASQERDIVRTLERLGSRGDELDAHNLAEAVALVVWDPETGKVDPNVPSHANEDNLGNLRVETLHQRVERAYLDRYKNLPPHQATEVKTPSEEADEDVDDDR